MKQRPILLIGGGGHCFSCIEAIESSKVWKIIGIVDRKERIGEFILGYPIVGTDADLSSLRATCKHALITVGQLLSADLRKNLYNIAAEADFSMASIQADSATIARTAAMGAGTIALHKSVVNSNAKIDVNCILNTGSIIEHDALIGAHTHISTGAIVNGGCFVGSRCLIGSGSVLKQGIRIADDVVVGAGAVVVNDIEIAGVYVGNPARRIR